MRQKDGKAASLRFHFSCEIINAPLRRFWLDGAAMMKSDKHFTLPACHAGGFGGL